MNRPGILENFGNVGGCGHLGGEAFGGDRLGRGHWSSFPRLGEQPGLDRASCPFSLGVIMSETAGLEDYGAQFGEAAATSVVEVDEREAGSGHRILQERDRRCRRQAILAAQMQKSADKAMAAVSIVITATRPVIVVSKKLEHEVEQLHCFCDFRFRHY
jgi:hypothetical protein